MLLSPGFLDYDNFIAFSQTVYQDLNTILEIMGFKMGSLEMLSLNNLNNKRGLIKLFCIKETCKTYSMNFPEKPKYKNIYGK